MRRWWRTALVAAALAGGALVPAGAAEPQQYIPVPSWAAAPTMQLGLWLPCGEGLAQQDCIEQVQLRRADATEWQSLTFERSASFDVSKAKQRWRFEAANQVNDPEWVDASPGSWRLPTGFANSDGSDEVVVTVMANPMGFVMLTVGDPREQVDLPRDTYWRVSLRSDGLPSYYSFVRSNAHDPAVRVPDSGHVKITVQVATSYRVYGRSCDTLTSDPTIKADGETQRIELILMAKAGATSRPGDLVLGTNGWWCFTTFGFNRDSGMIEVGVGTAHLDRSGKPIEGWMEAKIAGALAREWWGVDPKTASAYAKVSVTYEDGSTVLATTNARYDAAGDWIDLRSYGFHYSKPVLKVSFAVPGVTKPPVTKPAVKKTITCVKGTTVRKVTAVAPKCPAGFKLKK